MTFHLEGGCLCGQVRFVLSQAPTRTFACHCTFCQRVTGSAFFAEAIFPMAGVRFNEGRRRMYEHRSDQSGKKVYVHFCETCGSTLGLSFERWPDVHAIARGSLDDPNALEVTSHIWTRSAQSGVVLPADIDCFAQARATLSGEPETAVRHVTPLPTRPPTP